MVKLSDSVVALAQRTVLTRVWADPERRRLIVRLLFGGATGALTLALLHEAFKGMCRSPWEAVRLVVRLVAVVTSTIVGFMARGCKPKFKNWTLRFDILRTVIRECARGARGERMVVDAKHARVIRSQSAAVGTVLGWFACRQHGRRLEPVHANGLEHVWLRSAAPRTPTTKRFVVLYVHGGGFAVMSPRLYIAFAATLAVAIEKELRRQLGDDDSVQVDIFLGNYRKAPEHCFPTPPEDTVAAYKHLLHTEGIPPEQIILAGDSAGGGLVMSTLLRMRDSSSAHLPLAAILICPAVDLSEIEARGDPEAASAHCLLSPEMIAAGRLGYHTTASDPTTWADASSVHCDLRGLPPVFVQAATLDYIYQHSARLAQKAEADGVTNWELDVHQDLPHVFAIFPSYVLPYAQVGVQRVAAFAAIHFAKACIGDADAGVLNASAA
ncbi:CRN-like protein [Phytophthora cinnamomi]|uniref:CRN-like protein n=1 Tax=Phytophthora cinnamomi TaxID=4785 RepID=UPI00355A8422|nr:CRN-like protein [Phytophthora cinnamomi]